MANDGSPRSGADGCARAARPPRPLDGIRVLDLTTSVGGAFCSRLLADLGADVTAVEPPGGSRWRDSESLFAWLGAGKRSVVLPDAAPALARLAARADAVVTGFPVDVLADADAEAASEV